VFVNTLHILEQITMNQLSLGDPNFKGEGHSLAVNLQYFNQNCNTTLIYHRAVIFCLHFQ